jgi:hypothetical protein
MTTTARLAIGLAAALLVAVAILVALTMHYRAQREDAAAAVARLQATIQDDLTHSASQDQQVDSLTVQMDSLRKELDGWREQTEFDKSRLLDCWVVIGRIAPQGLVDPVLATYPGSGSEHSARSTRNLIQRCAAAAIP